MATVTACGFETGAADRRITTAGGARSRGILSRGFRFGGSRLSCFLRRAAAAPSEDVGGVGGYQRYLEALFDPQHEDHQAMLTWRGRFDPEYFLITSLNKRLREAFLVRSRHIPKPSVVSVPQRSSAPATFEGEFDLIVRSLIRSWDDCPRRNG